MGWGINKELLLNKYKVSMWDVEKELGWIAVILQNNVNVFSATLKWLNGRIYVAHILS